MDAFQSSFGAALKSTGFTVLALFGFSVLTWLFLASRPNLPTQQELEAEKRIEIRQQVQAADKEALLGKSSDGVVERLSIDDSMKPTALALLQREEQVQEEEQFLVPGSPTFVELTAAPAESTSEDDLQEESAEEQASQEEQTNL